MAADEQLIDYDRAAEITSISRRQLERMAAAGEFPAPVRVGRLVRFRLAEVVAWVRRQAGGRAVQTAALR